MSRLRYAAVLAALGAAGGLGWATAVSAPASDAEPSVLPVSYLDLMRATIDPSANAIWAAQGAESLATEDWLLIEKDAVDLAAAATLLSIPGAGPADAAATAAADWRAWAHDLQQAALRIRGAATAKDVDKLNEAADQMSDLCLACHSKYQTAPPADGVSRYPFYPARVREK